MKHPVIAVAGTATVVVLSLSVWMFPAAAGALLADLPKIWPPIAFSFGAVFIAAVVVRLVVRPRVTPETEEQRRDWQAW